MSFSASFSRRALRNLPATATRGLRTATAPTLRLATAAPRAPSTPLRLASVSASAPRWKTTAASSRWGPPIVKYEELKPITEQPSDDIMLVDVREPDETALGMIPSATNIPLSVLRQHLSSNYPEGDFRKEHGFPKPLPAQKLIFYCRSGKRSATAAEQASEAGYVNVRNYEGSWLDWSKREQEQQGAGFKDDDED